MSNSDPKFVRLPDRLVTGSMADLESGWFIGGYDVKPFPDPEVHPVAAAFVRDKVRQGHLEPAAKAEHDTVQASKKEMADLHVQQLDDYEAHDRSGHQEHLLQDVGVGARAKLVKLREQNAVDEEDQYQEPHVGSTQSIGGSEGPVDAGVTPSGATKPRRTR